jgi:hypothetical protein
MTPGRIAYGFALVALLSVLGIFLFPAMQGPYSAVHGPVTALLSIRAATRLRMIIVRAGLIALRDSLHRLTLMLRMLSWPALASTACDLNSFPGEFCTILRC